MIYLQKRLHKNRIKYCIYLTQHPSFLTTFEHKDIKVNCKSVLRISKSALCYGRVSKHNALVHIQLGFVGIEYIMTRRHFLRDYLKTLIKMISSSLKANVVRNRLISGDHSKFCYGLILSMEILHRGNLHIT